MTLVVIAIAFVCGLFALAVAIGFWLRRLDEADRRDADAAPQDFDSWLLP